MKSLPALGLTDSAQPIDAPQPHGILATYIWPVFLFSLTTRLKSRITFATGTLAASVLKLLDFRMNCFCGTGKLNSCGDFGSPISWNFYG